MSRSNSQRELLERELLARPVAGLQYMLGQLAREDGELTTLAVDGVFVAVGVEPQTKLVENQLSLDAGGYILAGEDTATAIPGVFAAGDCRKKPLRQVSTAVGDGATAAYMAGVYLEESANA